jgi:hypothetical protein
MKTVFTTLVRLFSFLQIPTIEGEMYLQWVHNTAFKYPPHGG